MRGGVVTAGFSNSLPAATRRDIQKYNCATEAAAAFSTPMMSGKDYAEERKKGGATRLGLEGGAASDCLAHAIDSVPTLMSLTIMKVLVEYDENGNPGRLPPRRRSQWPYCVTGASAEL